MKKLVLFSLSVLVLIALIPLSITLAHGQPTVTVKPIVVAAGGQITITGSDMEAGEVFTITLEGITDTIQLGNVTATKSGEEAGFTTIFTVPLNVTPESYTVRAATEEGESTTTDLTVTAPSDQASAGPATVQEPSGEPHFLDRTKPTGQIVGVGIIALLSLVLGIWRINTPGRIN